jgi:hypothetical protein
LIAAGSAAVTTTAIRKIAYPDDPSAHLEKGQASKSARWWAVRQSSFEAADVEDQAGVLDVARLRGILAREAAATGVRKVTVRSFM